MKRKVCVVTGSRADYGFLIELMKLLQKDSFFTLQTVVTGTHLSKPHGLTFKVIEADGFKIDEKITMLSSDDSSLGVVRSIAKAVEGFGKSFQRLKPDVLVLLGDRYETLAAAQAALILRIPVAHIVGGDVTAGAFDDAIRHAITKMSHLHFVTHKEAARRVRQMGEDPRAIFNVGSPSLDPVRKLKLLSHAELEKRLKFKFLKKNLLITFHPPTLSAMPAHLQLEALLTALDRLGDSVGLIFTKPNSDTEGLALIKILERFVARRANAKMFSSLGSLGYLSALRHVDAVVGNSSSGIYEAPSFKIPTVNIGDRQEGRIQASSILNCPPEAKAIFAAIQKAFILDCSKTVNPYGDGKTSPRIHAYLRRLKNPKALIKKHFFDLKGSAA